MKALSLMATEPVSSGLFAGLVWKLGLMAALGVLGGAIMAAFDPPKTRRVLFLQAAAAGTVSMVFGQAALQALIHFLPWAVGPAFALPVYFLVGALSWGFLGAVAKLRTLVAEKGAKALADKVGLQ